MWLSEGGERRRRTEKNKEKEEEETRDAGMKRVLSSASGRRAVAKVLLSPVWRRSLVAAHPPGPALDAALETHDKDTHKLSEALKKARVVVKVAGSGGGERRWELAESSDAEDDGSPMLWF